MKKTQIGIYFSIVLFFVLFFGYASYERQLLIDRYNKGVQYYEDEKYRDAMEIFDSLRGWGSCVDISPEDYYDMAVEKLSIGESDIIVCPNCGMLIK